MLTPYSTGYQIHDFSYFPESGKAKTLTTAIWYPSTASEEKHPYHRFLSGEVALNGSVDFSGSPYPLAIFSHGYLSCGIQLSYLCQYLASEGYVVAAPDHKDAWLCSIKGEKRQFQKINLSRSMLENASERLMDMRAVLDEMLRMNENSSSIFFNAINGKSIGVFGHSLGGWTVLGLSGAAESFCDNRVKAVLLLAPFFKDFDPQDFRKIKIPLMDIVGEKDQFTLRPLTRLLLKQDKVPRRTAYDFSNPPKYFLIVKEANHFSFTDYSCLFYKTVEKCQKSNPKAGIVMKYAAAFFNRYLKNDMQAEAVLHSRDPFVAEYEYSLG